MLYVTTTFNVRAGTDEAAGAVWHAAQSTMSSAATRIIALRYTAMISRYF